jgi:hypothetical protein
MQTAKRALLGLGALAVAGALVATTVNLSATDDEPTAASAETAALTSESFNVDELNTVFVPVSAYPEGTVLEQIPIKEAVAAGMLSPPEDIVIEPAACTDLLAAAVGDLGTLSGWVQRGERPDHRVVDALVATAPDGAKLAGIKKQVEACQSGTVTVESLGLTGTIELSLFEGPRLDGAETIGVQQTVTFKDDGSGMTEILEASGSSAQVYVSSGDMLLVACEDVVIAAIETATQMFRGLVGLSS